MSGVVTDTHGVIWYLEGSPNLSATARAAMDGAILAGAPIFVASITLIEVTYLVEKGRVEASTLDSITLALDDPASGFLLAPLDRATADVLRRVPREQVPDMPDRIIAATALHLKLPLISRDRKIRASAIQTIW